MCGDFIPFFDAIFPPFNGPAAQAATGIAALTELQRVVDPGMGCASSTEKEREPSAQQAAKSGSAHCQQTSAQGDQLAESVTVTPAVVIAAQSDAATPPVARVAQSDSDAASTDDLGKQKVSFAEVDQVRALTARSAEKSNRTGSGGSVVSFTEARLLEFSNGDKYEV